ncbi:hypothetical protein TB1_006388 [Malus domestica]
MRAGWAAGAGWITGAGWIVGAGWATRVGWITGAGCSMRGARECEAWAWVHVNLDGTARVVVKAPWTSPRVATEVATVVVPMVAVVKAP